MLAYGLTAFWLVPSYLQVTARNLQYVAGRGNVGSISLAALVAVAFCIGSWRLARGRPERTWAVFTAGAAVFFSLDILGNSYFNFRVVGEPQRLVPKLDLVYVLGAITCLRWCWNRPSRLSRSAAAAIVVASFATTMVYLRHARSLFPVTPDYQSRVEYRISDWLAKNLPNARVMATRSVRFWFDVWHDLAQLGGGSDQGLMNPLVTNAQWVYTLGPAAEPGILWMQCLGVDAVYVSSRGSEEPYKDSVHPEKFAGVLPVLYDDHQGNVIYRVPRRWLARARVVDTRRLESLHPSQGNADVARLQAYADVVERGPDQAAILKREGSDAMEVSARVMTGQSVVVQETYDPAWQAWSGGRRLPVHPDVMGFLVVAAPPGDPVIRLRFARPLENRIGWARDAWHLGFAAWRFHRGDRYPARHSM